MIVFLLLVVSEYREGRLGGSGHVLGHHQKTHGQLSVKDLFYVLSVKGLVTGATTHCFGDGLIAQNVNFMFGLHVSPLYNQQHHM